MEMNVHPRSMSHLIKIVPRIRIQLLQTYSFILHEHVNCGEHGRFCHACTGRVSTGPSTQDRTHQVCAVSHRRVTEKLKVYRKLADISTWLSSSNINTQVLSQCTKERQVRLKLTGYSLKHGRASYSRFLMDCKTLM